MMHLTQYQKRWEDWGYGNIDTILYLQIELFQVIYKLIDIFDMMIYITYT